MTFSLSAVSFGRQPAMALWMVALAPSVRYGQRGAPHAAVGSRSSHGRLGSKNEGKKDEPSRLRGTASPNSPTRVSHSLGRYPFRCVTLSALTPPRPAPICALISASINYAATTATASRTKSACSHITVSATTRPVAMPPFPGRRGTSPRQSTWRQPTSLEPTASRLAPDRHEPVTPLLPTRPGIHIGSSP